MDSVKAFVTGVVDGDTFNVHVIDSDPSNKRDYGPFERVRLQERVVPKKLSSPEGSQAKASLERDVLYRNLRLQIHSRDMYGQLVATYSLS